MKGKKFSQKNLGRLLKLEISGSVLFIQASFKHFHLGVNKFPLSSAFFKLSLSFKIE